MAAAQLLEGSEAIADAMIAAGCRFFAGYPMTPFTEVLEHMAAKLPAVGGVCMNAESEIEAVGMAWGAAATGTPAATGSTGQGLSLMQESLAEIALARLPLVVLNMARAQGDYFQATRGGGHGDYRHLVLAPADVVVVAFGTPARYVRAAIKQLRADGAKVGYVRPITLFPFPTDLVAHATANAKAVAVYENNQGQMIDDVRLAVLGRAPVRFIGGLSLDSAGFGIAPDLDVAVLRQRIDEVLGA